MRKFLKRFAVLLSEETFSYLTTLFEMVLWVVCLTVKSLVLSPASGETHVKSKHAYFSPSHSYSRTSVVLSINLLSCGSVKKFTGTSFFTHTMSCQTISNKTSLTRSYRYLKSRSFLQWIVCFLTVSKHTLQQLEKISLIRNIGIIRWYIKIVRYSTGDICWHSPSTRIVRRKS